MPTKSVRPVLFLAACLLVGLTACQRRPPAAAPPVAVPAQPPPSTPTEPVTSTEPPANSEITAAPVEDAEDWVLTGTLGSSTTRLQLETRFGKANVTVETFDGAEGDGRYPVLVVFAKDPRKRLELVQDADNPDAPITELRVSDPASQWHDANGLRPGMTLAELVALNGAPVSFYGLGWDYGGGVQDWHGGKLANAVDAATFHRVSLVTRKDAGAAHVPEGDSSFRSDDRRYPTMGNDLIVGELGISWPHDGEE